MNHIKCALLALLLVGCDPDCRAGMGPVELCGLTCRKSGLVMIRGSENGGCNQPDVCECGPAPATTGAAK